MSEELTTPQEEKLDAAYNKRTVALLEFCQLVSSKIFHCKQKVVAARYKVSEGTVSKWVTIGESNRFRAAKDLPASTETLYGLALLSKAQFKKLKVTASTTRKDVQAVKPKKKTAPKAKTPKSGAKPDALKKTVIHAIEVHDVDIKTVREWLDEWEREHNKEAA